MDVIVTSYNEVKAMKEEIKLLRAELKDAKMSDDVGGMVVVAAREEITRLRAELAEVSLRRQETVAMCDQLQSELQDAKEKLIAANIKLAALRGRSTVQDQKHFEEQLARARAGQ